MNGKRRERHNLNYDAHDVSRPEHVNISEMIIFPVEQVAVDMLHREGDDVKGLFYD